MIWLVSNLVVKYVIRFWSQVYTYEKYLVWDIGILHAS